MTPSQECRDLIKQFEGFSARAYKDGQYYSIGYGHHGPEVYQGQRVTEEEALELLDRDLAKFGPKVARLITVPVSQYMYDALVSFSYNVGEYALKTSTLLRMLNSRRDGKAAAEFLRWDKIKGIPSEGLARRRKAERDLFLRGANGPVDCGVSSPTGAG